jgi:hypothetical protein
VSDATAVDAVAAVLRRIRTARPAPRPSPGERCEMCAEPITDDHRHVVDLERRSLLCTCRACFLVFSPEGAGGARFRAVPDRYLAFDGIDSDALWEQLDIPVGVAFFFLNSTTEELAAFYPSPAGATESLLPLDSWRGLVARNQELATMRPDVEALLVWGSGALRGDGAAGDSVECFLVPIDVCYELVGQLRRQWRGFDGGTEVHAALAEFFARVRSRAGAEVSR